MKKQFIFIIIFSIIIVLLKYWYSDYNLTYKVNGYNIKSNYENNRLYIEINKDNKSYNFDMYLDNIKDKYKITKIKEIITDEYTCIYPTIKDVDTYPLCIKDNINIDYNLIDLEELNEYKKSSKLLKKELDFEYNKNLSNNEYIALWNYKGFYIMNNNSYENIELFKSEHYDNTLTYLYNDTLYIADYDSEHTFNKLILLNIKTKDKQEIKLNYDINFDSYFVGSIGKYIYIYDNKESILYELNTKTEEIVVKYNNETGYKKYDGKEFISCSKSEYKVNKISFDTYTSLYEYKYNKGYYKIIKNNKNIKQLFNNNKITILKENKNELYYLDKNIVYKYNPSKGNIEILYNNELEFNNENMLFIYLNN